MENLKTINFLHLFFAQKLNIGRGRDEKREANRCGWSSF